MTNFPTFFIIQRIFQTNSTSLNVLFSPYGLIFSPWTETPEKSPISRLYARSFNFDSYYNYIIVKCAYGIVIVPQEANCGVHSSLAVGAARSPDSRAYRLGRDNPLVRPSVPVIVQRALCSSPGTPPIDPQFCAVAASASVHLVGSMFSTTPLHSFCEQHFS